MSARVASSEVSIAQVPGQLADPGRHERDRRAELALELDDRVRPGPHGRVLAAVGDRGEQLLAEVALHVAVVEAPDRPQLVA